MNSNVSDVAETDEDILTFDIPDDALEHAAGAAPLITLIPCTFQARLRLASIAKLEAPTFVRSNECPLSRE